MAPEAVVQSIRLSAKDGIWLTFALLLHASLFLIPIKQSFPEKVPAKVLALSLLTPQLLKAVPERPEEPAHENVHPKPDMPSGLRHPVEPPLASPPEPHETHPEDPPLRITTARLVDSISQLKWSLPRSAETRQLGIRGPREVPENWRPGAGLNNNLFDGMTVPAETEVVDIWQAADGSRNLVINTPNGQTLCGRAEAWDPLRPMIVHLMMFRTCGGGGERTFKMPDRFIKHLVN